MPSRRSAIRSSNVTARKQQPASSGPARISVVRHLALTLLVGILSLSATGVARLIIGEPCTSFTLSAEDDGDCPPMCVTCGCCAQAVEPTAIVVAESIEVVAAQYCPVLPTVTESEPRDILHVPKLHLA